MSGQIADSETGNIVTSARPSIDVALDPRWERMPVGGAKIRGASRSTIYRWIQHGMVRGKVVSTHPGSKTGLSYFSMTDVEALINGAPDLRTALSLARSVT